MKGYARADRVSNKILTTLTELLRKKVNDPRLESVTVTGVKVSKDLRDAYIYFTAFGTKKAQRDALKGFESAQGFLRKALASEVGLRYMPKLRFVHDESIDYGAHINSLLKDLSDSDTEETPDDSEENS